jgi:hypothetical protein
MEGWRFTIMKRMGIGVIAFRDFGHGIPKRFFFAIAFRVGIYGVFIMKRLFISSAFCGGLLLLLAS